MKELTLVLACLLISFCSKGQNITLDQLSILRTKSLAEVEEFLTLKGWSFTEVEPPTDTSLGMASFYYKGPKSNGEMDSRITYFYKGPFSNNNKICVWVYNIGAYNTFMGRIKSLGFKLISTEIEENTIVNAYYNGNNIISAKIYPTKSNARSKECVFLIKRRPSLIETATLD